MEQLSAKHDRVEYLRMEVAKMLRKVKVKLSRQQLEALRDMLRFDIASMELPVYLQQKAYFIQCFKLYEKVDRTFFKTISNPVKMSFDIVEATHLLETCEELSIYFHNPYEQLILTSIISQINLQTV